MTKPGKLNLAKLNVFTVIRRVPKTGYGHVLWIRWVGRSLKPDICPHEGPIMFMWGHLTIWT